MTVRIDGVAGLQAHAETDLGATAWREMTLPDIQAFADATGDQQWIHVDGERARRESPFGAPIAHGYFTLSLVAGQFLELLSLEGFQLVINYGCDKVRFPSPLKEGDRWRLRVRLGAVTRRRDWWEGIFHNSIEIEGGKKPACVAECVYRFLPAG